MKKIKTLQILGLLLMTLLSKHSMATLTAVGPVDPANGFPQWYQDANGLKLTLCAAIDPLCPVLEGVDTTIPISFPGNFPTEAFWWSAETSIDLDKGGKLLVIFALESGFVNGVPAAGDRISFARIRMRGTDLPVGKYKIQHPFGQSEFTVTDPTGRGINFTSDVGAAPEVFTGALGGGVGPFLRWDPQIAPAAPAGYIGNPAVPHEIVTGNPRNRTNFVRVDGPSRGQTRLFNVAGKIFVPPVPYAPMNNENL